MTGWYVIFLAGIRSVFFVTWVGLQTRIGLVSESLLRRGVAAWSSICTTYEMICNFIDVSVLIVVIISTVRRITRCPQISDSLVFSLSKLVNCYLVMMTMICLSKLFIWLTWVTQAGIISLHIIHLFFIQSRLRVAVIVVSPPSISIGTCIRGVDRVKNLLLGMNR